LEGAYSEDTGRERQLATLTLDRFYGGLTDSILSDSTKRSPKFAVELLQMFRGICVACPLLQTAILILHLIWIGQEYQLGKAKTIPVSLWDIRIVLDSVVRAAYHKKYLQQSAALFEIIRTEVSIDGTGLPIESGLRVPDAVLAVPLAEWLRHVDPEAGSLLLTCSQ
jgi:hypothetical protein